MRILLSALFLAMLAGPAFAQDEDMAKVEELLASKEYDKAVALLEDAARRNQMEARYRLGVLYRDGIGVSRDPEKAFEWFQEASGTDWMRDRHKFGYPNAHYALGVMYRDGIGTERDPEEAIYWLEQAADTGHTMAQLVLGEMYLRGDGIDADYASAYKWLSIAARSFSEFSKDEKPLKQRATEARDEAGKRLSTDVLASIKKEIEDWSPINR